MENKSINYRILSQLIGKYILVLPILIFVISCHKDPDNQIITDCCCPLVKVDSIEQERYINFVNENGIDKVLFEINDITLEEDNCIFLEFQHYGGCKRHFFQIETIGEIYDDLVPTLDLLLYYDNKSDPCDAYITEVKSFDITEYLLADNEILKLNFPFSEISFEIEY